MRVLKQYWQQLEPSRTWQERRQHLPRLRWRRHGERGFRSLSGLFLFAVLWSLRLPPKPWQVRKYSFLFLSCKSRVRRDISRPECSWGLYGAAIRQHMRKSFLFFKYCNTQVHQSKSQGLGRSRKSRQHQRRVKSMCVWIKSRVSLEELQVNSEVKNFEQPAVKELGSGPTTWGQQITPSEVSLLF